MTYILKDRKWLLIPNLYILWPIKGHQRPNLGQIIALGSNRTDYNINTRPIRLTQGHQRSNLGQTRLIGSNRAGWSKYIKYTCFNSGSCRRLKFKIIWGQIRSYKVIRGQLWVKLVIKEWNRAVWSNFMK